MITKKRQDIIGGSIAGLIWPDRDRVIFDIPIDVDIPLEIMICRKKDVKKTQEEMPNINKLIGPIPTKSFSNTQLTVLADSPESIEIVFPKRFASAFEKYEKHLEFLHVTDQRVYTNYPLVLKCEILMGEHPSEFADSVKLLEVIIDLVDHIAKPIKLPSKVLEKSKKLREVEEKKREKAQRDKRQQEIEEKREQREREEREKLKQMTPAEKQKYKEKIQKQERKKQMKGRNKVMKF